MITVMATSPKIKIAIAEDHEFVRKAVCMYIATLVERFVVVGEFSDGKRLINSLKENLPDIIILDLEMPVMDGVEVLKILKKEYPNIKVVVLSAHYNDFYCKEIVLLGAAAYLPKTCTSEEFVAAISGVVKAGFYLNPDLRKDVVLDLVRQNKAQFMVSDKVLTDREIQIVSHLAEGLHYREIGALLGISLNTVKFHIKAIYKKTGLNTNAALIKYAIRVGLSGLESDFTPKFGSHYRNNYL